MPRGGFAYGPLPRALPCGLVAASPRKPSHRRTNASPHNPSQLLAFINPFFSLCIPLPPPSHLASRSDADAASALSIARRYPASRRCRSCSCALGVKRQRPYLNLERNLRIGRGIWTRAMYCREQLSTRQYRSCSQSQRVNMKKFAHQKEPLVQVESSTYKLDCVQARLCTSSTVS